MEFLLERIIAKYNLKNFPYWAIPQAIINKEFEILKEEVKQQEIKPSDSFHH
jgi:hypothetical protein